MELSKIIANVAAAEGNKSIQRNPPPRDLTDIREWLPVLIEAGASVPKTIIVNTDVELIHLLDGKRPDGYDEFACDITDAAAAIGYPCFLRTSHTSSKHQWNDTCYVPDPSVLLRHVTELVEFSECADLFGIPYRAWVVREFLSLQSTFTAFRGLPINRERRYFIVAGRVLCHHPYWPERSIEGHTDDQNWRTKLAELNHESAEEVAELTATATKIAKAFDAAFPNAAWSLDFAADKNGKWWAIDMAVARRSFHWGGCSVAGDLSRPPKEKP